MLAVLFGSINDRFYTAQNFVNLLLQMAGVATIAIGVVFVLLIAEIDLSVGFVSGVGGVITTLLLRPDASDWPWWAAILAGLGATTAIGLLQGLIITKARVPSFVVTLAGHLAWSGVVLILTTEFSTSGTIRDPGRRRRGDRDRLPLRSRRLAPARRRPRRLRGARAREDAEPARRRPRAQARRRSSSCRWRRWRCVGGLGVWYANTNRGVPQVVVIVGVFLVFWTFVADRTRFGRHVYAVGGNPEAARRAGIDVDRIRIAVFMISGFMAGVGGIILASRLRSVDTGTGGGELLLNVIAAAVIGGTSLFGGHGRVVSALLGARGDHDGQQRHGPAQPGVGRKVRDHRAACCSRP